MAKINFLQSTSILVLDGATGTELAKRGLPAGVCPEIWVLEHPEAIHSVQQAYEAAGSNIVYTPTFGGNPVKLGEFGYGERCREINAKLAEIVRSGLKNAFVLGDMAPTGRFVEPFGDFAFEDAVNAYKEQVRGLIEGGVDGFAIETMMDLQEARAALIAVRELTDLPVITTMTIGEGGRTLTGNSAEACAVTLEALGTSAVGCNCSSGPVQMAASIAAIASCVRIPVVAKPNAGMPRFIDGRTVFEMQPEEFGRLASNLVKSGASIVGGCCGTTPAHIAELAKCVKNCVLPEKPADRAFVASARKIVEIGQGSPFEIIGERLNPTGKKALQAELRAGKLDLVRRYAREQAEAGAALLDVNCGLSGINEADVLNQCVKLLATESDLPLCIDTTNPEAVQSALRIYPGRALFNSISAEKSRLEDILPIVAKYGAEIIVLPLDEGGIPDFEGRKNCIERIYSELKKYGYGKRDMVVDGLVMSVATNANSAMATLKTIRWCAEEFGVATVCGLSNVSHGLPARPILNQAFLSSAAACGLNMAIANPMANGIMEAARASDVLLGRDGNAMAFINAYSSVEIVSNTANAEMLQPEKLAYSSLISGDANALIDAVRQMLGAGQGAGKIVNEILIPAITEVGERYEKHEFFLPQLMNAANAMKAAMEILEPLLGSSEGNSEKAGKVIIATVKGDIHDIGKNIVVLMLKNYNFNVIDLGKDVPAEKILDCAVQENVNVVCLSALMTTTMGEMKHVVEMARERGLDYLNFIVGGAVVDEDFAASISAFYSKDAMATVRLAQQLVK